MRNYHTQTYKIIASDLEGTLPQNDMTLSVGNACNELKTVADEIICANTEHVAKYVFEHYYLK